MANPGIEMALLATLRKLEKLIDLGVKVLEKQFPDAAKEVRDGEDR